MATFSGLTLNKVGSGYRLQLPSSGLTGATSTAITVTSGSKARAMTGQAPGSSLHPGFARRPGFVNQPGFVHSRFVRNPAFARPPGFAFAKSGHIPAV